MDRRCAAGALLALAACIATTAAAPTASNQTALDLYEGASEGCYYNFQHYGEGDRIMTNEPCLNCTCHNRMLMCYLRVCPFTKPIGQDCSVEKRADQCCPIVTCPDVPVDLLTSTSTSSPSEYGETGLGKLDRYGCSINGKYFPEGSKVPPSPNKPCEHCYCIRNMTTCVMQECTLHVDGCTPIYRKDVCCPVRYSCDHPEDEVPLLDDMTTTVRPTPGFLLTTTTLAPVTQMTQDCVHDDKIFADGALIKTEKACEHCYCMKGDIVCVVQECGTPMENEGKNCTSMPPREGQCCPDTYICEGDDMTTETKPDITAFTALEDVTTLSPPRRVSVEGSGYRSETDEPSTEEPLLEPDTEGSGEDQPPFKPTDASEMLIPESETSPPLTATDQDEIVDHYSRSTTAVPEFASIMTEKITTEADKGENTVPSGEFDEETSEASVQDKTSPEVETTTRKLEEEEDSSVDSKPTTLPEDDTFVKDKTTPHEEISATEPAFIAESTISDHELHTSLDEKITSEDEVAETTIPTRRKEDDEIISKETTTLKPLEESTTRASDVKTPDTIDTETTSSSFIEQEAQTTISQITEKDKDAEGPSTELHLEVTTEPDVIKSETQPATTEQPHIATEFTTLSKVEFYDTTSANPIENEIDEESFPTLAPGRIPGEGDCLLDGVTYSHESIVPSSSNCHTSCKCVSSIVKCEPIVCSPPPDYMDNCQPMYDTPESCCPTYVCDHPKETVPPQSHSQMAGTETPIPTPTMECDGDQCQIIKDKEDTRPPGLCTSEGCTDESSKKPNECGPQGCEEVQNKPEVGPVKPTEQCTGDDCSSAPEDCTSGKCEPAIPKDQTCNEENGCEIPITQTCEGGECAIPGAHAAKNDSTPCVNPDGCKDQTCNNENGCEIPVQQTCQGENCAIQPDVTASKNDTTHCDDPESCKDIQIPEKVPDCEGESCISKPPSHSIPQAQDCKDSNDCGQSSQTPSVAECNEEECKTQQIPESHKLSPSDCIGTDCKQQHDHVTHITDVPEIGTESAPRVTGLPEETETISEESVSALPKTTAGESDVEHIATTEAIITDKNEESSTTEHDAGIDDHKISDTPTISEKPETITQVPAVQQEENITDSPKTETTSEPLEEFTKVKEVTSSPLEGPTTETTSLSDKETEKITTELPSFVEPETPESTTKSIIDEHSPVSEDDTKHEDTIDITTTEPAIRSTSAEISHETTKLTEMLTLAPESLDRDGHEKPTKEPEYVQDTDDKITESTERYTTAFEQITDTTDEQPIQKQESQGVPTTPKSYESPTTTYENLETDSPETQTASPVDEDKKSTESPVSTPTPEEPTDGEPEVNKQMSSTTEQVQTKAPEIVVDDVTSKQEQQTETDLEFGTHPPEVSVTKGDESITKTPDIPSETESQTEVSKLLVTLPQEISAEEIDEDKKIETQPPIIVDVQTQTPMSIVKDHSDDEYDSTATPKLATTTDHITTQPESPDSTQSLEPIAQPGEKSPEEPTSDIEKIPSLHVEDHTPTTSEAPSDDLGTSTATVAYPSKQPVADTDKPAIMESETSTDSLSESVTITNEPMSSESPVTEGHVQESSVPQEETSDTAPYTVIPRDDDETKLPTTVTVSSVQPISEEAGTITTVQDNEEVTELPELIVHEHPTDPSLIEKESEQPATEGVAIKEEDIVTEKESSIPDDVTLLPEIPDTVTQKEASGEPEQESTTKAPESFQKETTEPELHDVLSHIPDSSSTVPQKEVTEGPELQATTTSPEITATDSQSAETPAIEAAVTSAPKVSETEPQGTITEQATVEDTDMLVTEPHKDTTDAPVPSDTISNLTESPETATVPHKDSSATFEEPGLKPQEETTKMQDVTTTVPELSPTEIHKEVTETPVSEDVPTETDTSSDRTHDKATEQPTPYDMITIAPEVSVTETQDKITEAPDVVTPEIVSKEEITKTPTAQDITTKTPEVSTLETVSVEDANLPTKEEKITVIPEIETTETPAKEESSTLPQKKITDVSAAEETATNLPETSTTYSDKDEQAPEAQDITTNVPESPETQPKKEITEIPESHEGSSPIPTTPSTEPKKDITEIPEAEASTQLPESSADTKAPETIDMESEKDVTNVPEREDGATSAPEVTLPEKEITDSQESSEKPLTEPHVPTEPSDALTTESQKQGTEAPEMVSSYAPEMFATKSDKETTEVEEQELATKAPEPEIPSLTEKDETVSEPPFKITTILDDHTQYEPHDFVTPTESSKPESEASLPTEGGPSIKPDTKVPESLATESPEKVTDAETEEPAPSTVPAEDKPDKEQEIHTEMPFEKPAQTEPITESSEPETKVPELIETVPDATAKPEIYVTEKVTEPTNAPVQEDVPKAPDTLDTEDTITKMPEEIAQTSESKEEYPETTPYLVILEEHTHKTILPDEESSTSPTEIPSKEYELSTPDLSIDKVTEPAPSTESEKLPSEDQMPDKDQYVPELTQTTVTEKSTQSSKVSDEITTPSHLPEFDTSKPVESNEISTSAPTKGEEPTETEKPLAPSVEPSIEKETVTSEKPQETIAPEEELILATTKATTIKVEEESTTLSPLLDKFGKPEDEVPKPAAESEKPKPDVTEEIPKPGANEVQPTDESIPPEEDAHFPPSGTSGYGQEPDYGEEDSFGPGTCRYGGKVYVSAQQIPRDDPCDFCFCFRSDIICLQQSCPPPIHGCHEEPIQGFCCPRYECPVSMATTLNVTTTTTTTTTTLPPHFLPHAYKGAAQRRGCQIKGHTYKVGEVVRASSGPCLHCTCGGDGQMKCDPKVCTPEPMLRQMIAAAVSAKRRR